MDARCLVLVVEDNHDDEMLAMRALKRSSVDCQFEVVRDGQQAVDYLSNQANPLPNLVLLDLKMPKVSGLEVLRFIRNNPRTRRIPVVCFTSSSEQSDVMGCFDEGANSYVRKSTDYETFMDRLARVAQYWIWINEPCKAAPA